MINNNGQQDRSLSEEARRTRRTSGLPGWIHRPVKRLNWTRLTGKEREDAIDRLSPGRVEGEVVINAD